MPEDQNENFGEMPPLVKNINYNDAEGGEYMSKINLAVKREVKRSKINSFVESHAKVI